MQFSTAVIIFLCAVFFMYSQLSKSYLSYVETRNVNEINLYANTVPERGSGDEEYRQWAESVTGLIPGARAYCFNIGFSSLEPLGGSETALRLWESNANTASFKEAEDSVYYNVMKKLGKTYKADYSLDPEKLGTTIPTQSVNIYFAPVLDESGNFSEGAVMVLVPESNAKGFISILRVMLIAFSALFIFAAFVIMFTRDPVTGFLILGLFAVVIVFVAYPLFEAFRLSFIRDGKVTLATWKMCLSPEYLKALWGSLQLGVLTATLSTLIGYMFAFLIERTPFRHKKGMTTLCTMPMISPPFSLSLSIILLFGNNGLITKQLLHLNSTIYGLGGLVFVETIGMFPIAFLSISAVLRQIDSTMEDASLDLSATKLQTFLKVTLPLSMPGILSAWLLVFTNSLADFANPQLLAGNFRVLSTEAYMMVTGARNDTGGGAVLSLMLLVPTLSAFLIQRFWVSKKSFVTVTGKPSSTLTNLTNRTTYTILKVVSFLIMGFIILLYLTILAGCFCRNWGFDYTFTLDNWKAALSRGWTSIRDTVTLAAIATPIAGLLAMIASMLIVRKKFPGKRVLEMLIMTPYAIPGTLIGISFIMAFNKRPLLLVGTGAILVINYVIRELPVGLENGVTALHQIDPSIEEAASDLGADTPTVFRTIVLPLVKPAFISSMSYTFVRSMTAVSAIIFLISARWNHLTVLILNFSENIRFGYASVLSTVLILIVLAVFGLLQLLARNDKMEKTITSR
ncbi:MAG: iron ABC transporter permease [Candidatus Ornithospirochaeta sp.]|nr:iron ABC transporter permease [Candidatus Ornithospirochaeta sp.]